MAGADGPVELFEVDELVDAVAPPALKFGGRLHVARAVSAVDYYTRIVPATLAMDAAQAANDGAAFVRAVVEFFRVFYPRPPWWARWRPDLAAMIPQVFTPREVGALVAGFLVSLRGTPPGATETTGSTSGSPDAGAPPASSRATPKPRRARRPVAVPYPVPTFSRVPLKPASPPSSTPPDSGAPGTG